MLFLTGPKWRTGARSGSSHCPRLGEGRERAESESIFYPYLPSPSSPSLSNPPRTRYFHPTSYIQLSATHPSLAKNAPRIKHAHRPFFFSVYHSPFVALKSRPSPTPKTLTNPEPNIFFGLPPCRTMLSRPLRFLMVSTTTWILSGLLGKWEQNANKRTPRCLSHFAFLSFHLPLLTVFPPFPPPRLLLYTLCRHTIMIDTSVSAETPSRKREREISQEPMTPSVVRRPCLFRFFIHNSLPRPPLLVPPPSRSPFACSLSFW